MTNATNIADRAKSALAKAQKPGTLAGLNSEAVSAILQPYSLAIANALPNGGRPDRIIQLAVFKITTDPRLAECSAKSIIGCVLNSSLLGLNPSLKQCHFVPRKNKATGQIEACFQFDYRGMVALARRSGVVADVFAQVVRRTDKFLVRYGTDKAIVHEPDLNNESEDFTAAYAVIRYINGGFEFVVMTPSQVEKRRAVAGQKKQEYDFWERWKEEMWKKTVLHHLLQTAPLSDEQSAAIATDGATLTPDNFQRGEVKAETLVYEEGEVIEAEDLAAIRKGVAECGDLDNLENYWKQGSKEWSTRSDVVEVFNARKLELSK